MNRFDYLPPVKFSVENSIAFHNIILNVKRYTYLPRDMQNFQWKRKRNVLIKEKPTNSAFATDNQIDEQEFNEDGQDIDWLNPIKMRKVSLVYNLTFLCT